MKIIDIAICIDNNDPKGIGRIRAVRYSSYTGELEKAFDYNAWDDKDLFTAIPFLPTNLNFIPEKGQAVKIINYDTDKDTVNLEYIAGPFTTVHDYNGQTHSAQLENTTYGIAAKHGEDVKDKDGNYIKPKSNGSLAKNTDYGVYGKYGSDVIFTENGVNIRGGKLLSKSFATSAQKKVLITHPTMSDNSSTIHLKKYPKKLEYNNQDVITNTLQIQQIKYFVEYNVTNFYGGGVNIEFYVYDTKNAGPQFVSSNSKLEDTVLTTGCTLINEYNINNRVNTSTGATLTFTAADLTEACVKIRLNLYKLHHDGLNYFNPIYGETEMHPFYFRPDPIKCKERTLPTSTELTNRKTLLTNVTFGNRIQNGIVFSKSSFDAPTVTSVTKKNVLEESDDNVEQTFATVKSDKIYLISTDTNEYNIPIDFTKIDKYEPTHENYIKDIEPNTYALVRGEVLIDVLQSIIKLMISHQHNLMGPLVQTDPSFVNLMKKITTLENDMLNKSIRTN
jgi:hypothetical protein